MTSERKSLTLQLESIERRKLRACLRRVYRLNLRTVCIERRMSTVAGGKIVVNRQWHEIYDFNLILSDSRKHELNNVLGPRTLREIFFLTNS